MTKSKLVLPLVGGVLGLSVVLLSAAAIDFPSDPSPEIALFRQCHNLSNQLDTFGHTYALLTLVKNSQSIISRGISKKEYLGWCTEMFQAAHGIEDGWDRIAQEKNAVLYMSDADPVVAMDFFKQIENPQPMQDGSYAEDVRSDSSTAPRIFMNYLLSTDSLSQFDRLAVIESEADRLGRTGEFPYAAMGEVIARLAQTPTPQSAEEISKIFGEALRFYDEGPHKFLNRNRQFYKFLTKTASVVNSNVSSKAANLFVNKLLHSPKDFEYQSEIETPKGIAHFNDDREELLFEAFPTIQKVAPTLAAQLLQEHQEHPELSKADEKRLLRSGGYDLSGAGGSQAQLMHDKTLQQAIVREIAGMNDSDLARGRRLAERLTDQTVRIQGYSALMPLLMKSSPQEALNVYYRERSHLPEIMDDDDHLRATVALAEASFHAQDSRSSAEFAATALEQGTILFGQDSRVRPQLTLSGRRGYNDLVEVVTFGTSNSLSSLPERIQKIESVELKANLVSVEAGTMVSKANQ